MAEAEAFLCALSHFPDEFQPTLTGKTTNDEAAGIPSLVT